MAWAEWVATMATVTVLAVLTDQQIPFTYASWLHAYRQREASYDLHPLENTHSRDVLRAIDGHIHDQMDESKICQLLKDHVSEWYWQTLSQEVAGDGAFGITGMRLVQSRKNREMLKRAVELTRLGHIVEYKPATAKHQQKLCWVLTLAEAKAITKMMLEHGKRGLGHKTNQAEYLLTPTSDQTHEHWQHLRKTVSAIYCVPATVHASSLSAAESVKRCSFETHHPPKCLIQLSCPLPLAAVLWCSHPTPPGGRPTTSTLLATRVRRAASASAAPTA